jgi:hypothetical protein
LPTSSPISEEGSSTQREFVFGQRSQPSDYHLGQTRKLGLMVYFMQTQWSNTISLYMPKATVAGPLHYSLMKFYGKYYSLQSMWLKLLHRISSEQEELERSGKEIRFLEKKIDPSVDCRKDDEGNDENKNNNDSSDEDNSDTEADIIRDLNSTIAKHSKRLRKHDAVVAKCWKKLSEQSKATLVQWRHLEADMQSKSFLKCIQDEVSYFKYCIFQFYNSVTHYKNTATDVNSIHKEGNDNDNDNNNDHDDQNDCLKDTKLLRILTMLNVDSHPLDTVEGIHDMVLNRGEWIDLLAKPVALQSSTHNGYGTSQLKRSKEDADDDKFGAHDGGSPRYSKKPKCRG